MDSSSLDTVYIFALRTPYIFAVSLQCGWKTLVLFQTEYVDQLIWWLLKPQHLADVSLQMLLCKILSHNLKLTQHAHIV